MKSTSYGAMKVSLAAKVLSHSMNSMWREFGPDAATEMANLCYYMDSFFDCTNVRSSMEYIHKRKPFLEPYKDLEDPRFNWLKIEFLGYFEAWEVSIESRTEASKTEK